MAMNGPLALKSAAEVLPAEFEAARLLLGRNRLQLAGDTGLSEATLKRIERGLDVRLSTRAKLYDHFRCMGVRFRPQANMPWWSGETSMGWCIREAPTEAMVGRLHGERLRIACYRLAKTAEQLSGATKVGLPTIRGMFKAKDLQARPTLALYAVVGWLQDQDYEFQRWSKGGDRAPSPRPRPPPRHRERMSEDGIPYHYYYPNLGRPDWTDQMAAEEERHLAGEESGDLPESFLTWFGSKKFQTKLA